MIGRLIIFWHESVLGHQLYRNKVTVPMFDPGALGLYVRCSCGSEWAL